VTQLEAKGDADLAELTATLAKQRDRKIRHLESAPPAEGQTVVNPPPQPAPAPAAAAAAPAEDAPAEAKPAETTPAEETPVEDETKTE